MDMLQLRFNTTRSAPNPTTEQQTSPLSPETKASEQNNNHIHNARGSLIMSMYNDAKSIYILPCAIFSACKPYLSTVEL